MGRLRDGGCAVPDDHDADAQLVGQCGDGKVVAPVVARLLHFLRQLVKLVGRQRRLELADEPVLVQVAQLPPKLDGDTCLGRAVAHSLEHHVADGVAVAGPAVLGKAVRHGIKEAVTHLVIKVGFDLEV